MFLQVGPLHLAVLNSENALDFGDIDPPQVQWLGAELSANTRAGKWTIAALHRPLYCTFTSPNECSSTADTLKGQVSSQARK